MDGGLITAVEITLLPFHFTIGLNATLYLIGFYSIVKDCIIFKSEYLVKTFILLMYLFMYLIFSVKTTFYSLRMLKCFASMCRLFIE